AEAALQRNLLAALAGKGADWGREIRIEAGTCTEQAVLPSDLPLRLLSHRPDISAARLQAEAAAEEIKVAETAFYPDVNLIAFTGLHSVSLSDVLLQGASLAYAVGPSIEFPIFEGGRLRANLSYQQAAYDRSVERYNASLVQAVREVADSVSRWRETGQRLAEQTQILADAAASEQLA
ncbi:TolC family protein, partial [Methylomonas rivi]